ncbi:phosphopantetheine-binding protein [Streptomyces sp. YS-3]|uniref:phosphopantetheine-binding protein n=1 Tax=Streptomyces sp. YS-3 TaxID=3381352 RepID=UPI00386237FD
MAAVSETVTRVISEVLKQPVALTDNLLELGVDSLVGTRIVVNLRSELGADVPLLLLFENPVLSDFVDVVAEVVEDPHG